jgi:hypothetical protein
VVPTLGTIMRWALPLGAAAATLTQTAVAFSAEPPPPRCAQAARFMHEHPAADVTCGHATVVARGKTNTIDGLCFRPYSSTGVPVETLRFLSFGATTERAWPHKGLSLVLKPGDRAGHVRVIDGQLDLVPGIRVPLSGIAFVDRGLQRGTFRVYGRDGPDGTSPTGAWFTGSWTCS